MSRRKDNINETYTETVVRMDEKLKGIVDSLKNAILENGNIRKEYLEGIHELTIHVNYEDCVLQARVKVLENGVNNSRSERKGALAVYRFFIAFLSAVVIVLTILKLLNII